MSSTRLLLLGVLTDGPVHGYEVRQVLESWNAAQWAHVNYSSIYSGLRLMTAEGLLKEVRGRKKSGGGPPRTTYALTPSGHAELRRLLIENLREVGPVVDPFQTALTFIHLLPRNEIVQLLQSRLASLRGMLAGVDAAIASKLSSGARPHIAENVRLMAAYGEAEVRFLEELVPKVKGGALP